MPTFAVLFDDRSNADPNIRRDHMPAHLSFLEANAGVIPDAGPLRGGDRTAAGGLWLVNAADVAEVDRLVHADPFWPTGLRETYRVLEWSRVFAEGQRVP